MYFKLFLAGLCLIVPCLTPLHLHADVTTQRAVNQADLLLDKVYAVHATRTLPEVDYLRAGWGFGDFTTAQKALLPQVRKTVHFSLGELVRPVEGFMSWEDCPYALVTPLRTLLPQLINVNCYDTFIFGNLKLAPNSYLILPVGIADMAESKATIVTYDPQNKTLREAVDELIFSKGGWGIEMNSDDIEDELHEAYLNGNNVNKPDFLNR
jgi:hypothetical protein